MLIKKISKKKWIREIQSRYKDRFNLKLLEKFSNDYPSLTELSEELGCTIQNVEKELKGIMRFLKYVEIYDLQDPINYRQGYFGWKNENIGQVLMRKEIFELLDNKNIECKIFPLTNNVKTLVIKKDFLIYPVFEEADLREFIKIYCSENPFNKFHKLILIVYSIELKDVSEKKIRKKCDVENIETYLYDWADLGPFVRDLMGN